MKHCRYNEEGKCNNPNSIFKGWNSSDFCSICQAGDEYKPSECRWTYGEGECGMAMPDSVLRCEGICDSFELCKMNVLKEENMEDKKVVIEGIGKDAEIVTNAKGGKQSKSPMAMHLVDPEFLQAMLQVFDFGITHNIQMAINHITSFMLYKDEQYLLDTLSYLSDSYPQALITIAKVLQEGAERYEANNWRLIPQEEHINHALIHLMGALMGDTQDNHIEHALTRIMMAYATEVSDGFSYTQYVKKAA